MLGFGRSSRPNVTLKTPQDAEDFFTVFINKLILFIYLFLLLEFFGWVVGGNGT